MLKMNFHGLRPGRKKAVIIAAAALLCIGGVGTAVALSGDDGAKIETSAVNAVKAENKTESVGTVAAVQESTEIEGLISFKKAGIEEYDMDFVAADIKLGGQQDKKKEAEKFNTPDHFTVAIPADKSVILKPEKATPSYPGSRSIAGEYYTVYDERSGGNVTLDGHELLCRIVNSEIGDSWGEEAIKAQAVAAYSYVRYNDECGYVPTVGLKAGYSAKLERCISEVEGECIYYGGEIIDAVYSASSAGASAPSEKIWGGAHPYLRAVVSEYDSKDPNYGVVKTFTKEALKGIIEKNTGLKLSDDPMKWFEIESVFSGKYVDTMKLDGKQYISVGGAQRRVTGALMRSHILGTDNLKSTAFEISYDNGVFTFKTFGWGHGVGMSQWGACYYAKAGYTYDQILKHYYTGVTIAVSDVNSHAAQRAQMTQEELAKQAEEAKNKQAADEAVKQTETADAPADTAAAEPQQTEQPAETQPEQQTAAEEPAQTEPEQTDEPAVTDTEQTEQPEETEVLPDETEEAQFDS